MQQPGSEIDNLIKMAAESASLTVRTIEKGSHEFVLKNYSHHKGMGANNGIKSEEFTAGGHHWAICFYPNGRNDDACKKGYISLYVSFESEDSANSIPILYELYLLDQSGKGKHWSHSIFRGNRINCVSYFKYRGSEVGKVDFIKRASIKPYLKDDCLKISCTVGVLDCYTKNLPILEVPKPNIETDLGRLLESKRGADVFFKVHGESFFAHKCVLSARLPLFWARFSYACQHKKEIVISDVEPRVFKAMLWFIYTGVLLKEEQDAFADSHTDVFNSFLGKMLAAADKFDLKRLKKMCESCILEKVSVESVANLLQLADVYGAAELKAACLRFAAKNQAAIMESYELEDLKETCPLLYLELAYKENSEALLSTSRERELELHKTFSVVKQSFGRLFCPPPATDDMKHKKKEI